MSRLGEARRWVPTFALHYTLPAPWQDPAESESIITPYLELGH